MTEYRKVQIRQMTAAQWVTNNPVLLQGEQGLETDTRRIKIGNGTSTWVQLPYAEDIETAAQIANGTYHGVDLAVKFAGEIAAGNYSSTQAWLHARVQARNYSGIYPGDYFNVSCSAATIDGNSVAAQSRKVIIAAIEPYRLCGDSEPLLRNHITCFFRVGEYIKWNDNNNNNGSENEQNPWRSSKLFAVLNGVNNAATNYGGDIGADAEDAGYFQTLPEDLQSYIVEQRCYLDKRYSATALLTETTGNAWAGRGKLFVPSEVEFYGFPIFSAGDKGSSNNAARGPYCQFPVFKKAGEYGRLYTDRTSLWLSSVVEGSSSNACYVNSNGFATYYATSTAAFRAFACFHLG